MSRSSRLLLCSNIFVLLSAFIWNAAYARAGTDELRIEETLLAGQYLILPDGERKLVMEVGGNLVFYGREVERLLWQSGTAGNPGAYYQMQDDGNLVVYSADGDPLWDSGTWGNPGSELVMEDNGNLVIYSPPRPAPLWDSGTAGNSGAYYQMQDDGNLVVYSEDSSTALWASDTSGHPGAELFIEDGNLAIFSEPFTEHVWSSQTEGNYGAELVMQGDGNLVIYSHGGVALWESGTQNRALAPSARYRMNNGELQVYIPAYCELKLPFSIVCDEWRLDEVLWGSGTTDAPDPELHMQDDGNLVIHSTSSTILWETGTGGHPGSELVMEEDGNLVLYSGPEPQVLWESKTAGDDHAGAELFMKEDGNLVIKLPPLRKAIWSTNTDGNKGAYVKMQEDGNLVVYSKDDKALWSSQTHNRDPFPPDPHLKLQSDGNLVVWWDTTPKWDTRTYMPWMEKLGDNIANFSIRKLAIPGTHDSGTYGLNDSKYADDGNLPEKYFKIDGYLPWHVEIKLHWVKHHTSWWPHFPYWTVHFSFIPHAKYLNEFAKMQGVSIYQQLHNGIRYIDLRVLYDRSNLYLIHALKGPNIFSEINQVNHYLRENPYEIVILDFNHFYTQNGSGSSIPAKWNAKLINHIQSTMGDLLIPPPDNVNDLTMNDIWASGKQVIVLYGQSGSNKENFWPGRKLRSEWFNEASWGGLEDAMNSEANCVVNLKLGCTGTWNQLWVMQGILSLNIDQLGEYLNSGEFSKIWPWLDGIKGAANSANGYVPDWALNGEYTQDLNILLGDWAVDADLAATAIQVNLKKAELDHLNLNNPIAGLPLNLAEPEPRPSTPLEATRESTPAVVPPADIRLEATGTSTCVAELGESSAYDYVDGWLEATHDAGDACFPIGTHTVTWSSSDPADVTGTVTQTVRIVSHKPVADKAVLWPPNHKMSTITIQANVVPSLPGLVTLSASVASNEPVEGDKGPDWGEPEIDHKKGIIEIPLRAERSALGGGRIYTVTVVATDSNGHQSEEFVHVDVGHKRN